MHAQCAPSNPSLPCQLRRPGALRSSAPPPTRKLPPLPSAPPYQASTFLLLALLSSAASPMVFTSTRIWTFSMARDASVPYCCCPGIRDTSGYLSSLRIPARTTCYFCAIVLHAI